MPHCLATRGSMACSTAELAAVLAVLATISSSWCVLYPNSGGFEGKGIAVDHGVFRRA
jgi:H+/gluconate symporter-like permease